MDLYHLAPVCCRGCCDSQHRAAFLVGMAASKSAAGISMDLRRHSLMTAR